MSLASHPSTSRQTIHPLHALLLAFPVALFTTALLSDIAYLKSAEIQWSNFSAWMITGALIFGAPVLLWAAIDLFRRRDDAARPRALVYLILVLVIDRKHTSELQSLMRISYAVLCLKKKTNKSKVDMPHKR